MADPTPNPDEQQTPPAPKTPAKPKAPKQYRVVAPLVITKKSDGSDLYVYEGAILPAFIKADEVTRLLEEQFVTELDGDSTPIAESN